MSPDSMLMPGDLVVVVGSENRMENAGVLFRNREISKGS
jgi:K+/H+ antiporter YhaU regulatory subunit KhtT